MDSSNARPRAPTPVEPGPMLWAVGGGKGGVGKSLVASSLAIRFARQGQRCVLVDLDLGAANAHSLLGMRPPPLNLAHFMNRRVETLAEILHPTPFENLEIAAGARATLDLANPKHSQKERLLRQIRTLDADHVFLDLSAGCAFNVLDFFLVAAQRIAVLIPEATAIENTQHFLKAAFFRSLRPVAQAEPLRSAIELALESRRGGIRSARQLVEVVRQIDAEAGTRLARQAAAFAPMLILNQVHPTAPARDASQIALACRHYLAASVRERGRLPRDERVRDAVARGTHVLEAFPGSVFSRAIETVADDLLARKPDALLSTPPRRGEIDARRALLPPLGTGDPGAYLRGCRERLGLSLAEVYRETRIRSLGQIEESRYAELPDESYVAAFVRQYAQTLGIAEVDRLTTRYLESYRTAVVAS